MRPFVEDYLAGRTPIPCVSCNTKLKFAKLVTVAREVGAEHVATGHYARVEYNEQRERYILKKGRDLSKDQSYFLFEMTQKQLARAVFPLGDMTKAGSARDGATVSGLKPPRSPRARRFVLFPTATMRALSRTMRDHEMSESAEKQSALAGGEISYD